jgi:HlyD family secretion protein
MAALSLLLVRALLEATHIGRVAGGQCATVSVDAYPGRAFVGRVLMVEPQAVVEQNVTMFPVLIQLDNREGLLKPGMNAEVAIEIAKRSRAVTVPTGAVVGVPDAPTAASLVSVTQDALNAANAAAPKTLAPGTQHAVVFVQDSAGVQPRRVVMGVSDWEHTEIVSGLETGEKVMLVSVLRMRKEQSDQGPNPFGGDDEEDEPAGKEKG